MQLMIYIILGNYMHIIICSCKMIIFSRVMIYGTLFSPVITYMYMMVSQVMIYINLIFPSDVVHENDGFSSDDIQCCTSTLFSPVMMYVHVPDGFSSYDFI